MDWTKYCKPEKWHDAAKLFPLLCEAEIESLAQDIAKNGLLNPIWLFQGKVLEGRNRLLACEKAGVEPKFEKWRANGVSPPDFVFAQNFERSRRSPTGCSRIAPYVF